MKKKLLVLICIIFLGAGLILAQSLAELAKKERERRQSLGDKRGIVVTNEDLAKVKRRPALETGQSAIESAGQILTGYEPSLGEKSSSEYQPSSTLHNVSIESPSSLEVGSRAGELKYLEEAHKKAQEYVELLTLKLNALWQEFYSLDDMTPRDLIQQAIAETYLKLQKAQEEEEKLRKELEKQLSSIKKENIPSLWIR